jgi:hypothetical protein
MTTRLGTIFPKSKSKQALPVAALDRLDLDLDLERLAG